MATNTAPCFLLLVCQAYSLCDHHPCRNLQPAHKPLATLQAIVQREDENATHGEESNEYLLLQPRPQDSPGQEPEKHGHVAGTGNYGKPQTQHAFPVALGYQCNTGTSRSSLPYR